MNVAASFNEPLQLADGTLINPANGKVIKDTPSFFEVPAPSEAQAIVVRARKSVHDLPVPPAQMNGIALVAFYTLFGLNDTDIAIALDGKLTEDQIGNIRKLTVYKDFMTNAKQNLLESAQEQVRELLQQHAHGAAKKVIAAVDSENDVLSFKAAQDVLDRTGHRPADIVEHRHRLEDALHIVIEHKEDTSTLPVIDVVAEHIDAD
jgi:hypothetical protein